MKPGKVTYVDIIFDTDTLESESRAGVAAVEGLEKALKSLATQIEDAFSKANAEPAITQTVNLTKYTEKCSDQLLYLRLNFGRLRAAIEDAAAPLGAVLLPAVNRTVYGLSQLADQVGLAMAALVEGVWGTDAVAQSAENAADAQDRLTASTKAARRSLAGFDQIQRLNAPTGGTAVADTTAPKQETQTLSPQLQAAVDKILALIEPLRQIDFTPLQEALNQLGQTFGTVFGQIGQILEWVWYELLMPLTAWIIEELAPAVTQTLTGALTMVCAALEPVFAGLAQLWQALEPLVAYIGQVVLTVLESWRQLFLKLAAVFQEKAPQIEGIFRNLGQVFTVVWEVLGPVLEAMRQSFSTTFETVGSVVASVTGGIIDALYAVTEFLAGAFTGSWERTWRGLTGFVKEIINGLIGLLNLLLAGITGALNGIIRMANSLRFTVPGWVPELGGSSFGLNLSTVRTPQIPYLAQGAVLPANRPFLAVVGDQRHGTNIEAPLGVIQQAVAQVTGDQNRAMLAAMEASLGVQQEILSAVLGIRIGDDLIAQAADRYRSKMAVVYGTGY